MLGLMLLYLLYELHNFGKVKSIPLWCLHPITCTKQFELTFVHSQEIKNNQIWQPVVKDLIDRLRMIDMADLRQYEKIFKS